jgi:hypothetical protein
MVHTAKSCHGNEEKSLELHLGLGVVGGVCFDSLIDGSRVETKSMLEYLGLLVLDTWMGVAFATSYTPAIP